jgi:hypothetical protein
MKRQASTRTQQTSTVCDAAGASGDGVSNDPENVYERAAVQYMMRRLDGFAREIGLDEGTTRGIVKQVVADMPLHTVDERLECARDWLLMAATA